MDNLWVLPILLPLMLDEKSAAPWTQRRAHMSFFPSVPLGGGANMIRFGVCM